MKKIVLMFLLVISGLIANKKYELIYLLEEPVYFPKSKSDYLNDLLNSEDKESLLDLALYYSRSGRKEAALNYLDEYSGDRKWVQAELYNNFGQYEKELLVLEEYFSYLEEEEYRSLYEYIIKLKEEHNLQLEPKYDNFNIFYLTSLVDKPNEFYEFYNSHTWTQKEKNYFEGVLFNINLRENEKLREVYFDIATNDKKLMKTYGDIYSLEDTEGYNIYFALQEELGVEIEVKNDFELLHKLRYKGKKEKYEILYEKVLNEIVANMEYDKLMTLYFISGNYKLAYNLALEREEFHFQILDKFRLNNEKEAVLRAIEDFKSLYPNSKYDENLILIELSLQEGDKEKLEVLSRYFSFYYNNRLARDYLRMIKNTGNVELLRETLEEFILEKGIEKDFLLKEYIELIEGTPDYLEKVKQLSDKKYYFQVVYNGKLKVEPYYEKEYVNYLLAIDEIESIREYKDNLSFGQYRKLVNMGYSEYKVEARSKYPLEELWMDFNSIKYFYLNKNYLYDGDIAEKLTEKETRSGAEDYYLMKYYEQSGNGKKANEIRRRLSRRYPIDMM